MRRIRGVKATAPRTGEAILHDSTNYQKVFRIHDGRSHFTEANLLLVHLMHGSTLVYTKKRVRCPGAFGGAATPRPTQGRGQRHPKSAQGPLWSAPGRPRATTSQLRHNLGRIWTQLGANLGHYWGRFWHSGRVAPDAAVFFASGPHSGLMLASILLCL